jgi:uncharacterized membrane protein
LEGSRPGNGIIDPVECFDAHEPQSGISRVIPDCILLIGAGLNSLKQGSSGRTRTYNPPVNSRLLCRLSYRGRRTDYKRRFAGASRKRPCRSFAARYNGPMTSPPTNLAAAQTGLFERRAVRITMLLLAALVVGLWLAFTPSGLLGKADAVAFAVCHRIDVRSFHIGERAMPLCARCTGMHLGALVTTLFFLLRGRGRAGMYPSRALAATLGLFALVWAIDGLNSYVTLFPGAPHLYEPSNLLRLTTGMLLGVGLGTIVYATFNQSVWRSWDSEPGLRSFVDLAVLLAIEAVVILLVLSENTLLLYPLAVIASLAVLGILTAVYTVMLLLFLKRENQASSWHELAFPLLGGFTITILQIGLINLGRYLLTGSWSGIGI